MEERRNHFHCTAESLVGFCLIPTTKKLPSLVFDLNEFVEKLVKQPSAALTSPCISRFRAFLLNTVLPKTKEGLRGKRHFLLFHPTFLHVTVALLCLVLWMLEELQNVMANCSVPEKPLPLWHCQLMMEVGWIQFLAPMHEFGFSNKQSGSTIGQYGNGFKTSTMRFGADVIVFSCCMKRRKVTHSIGLLSYTFLRKTGCDDIVVPVVDYVLNPATGAFNPLLRINEKQFSTNLFTLLKWSPFATEEELLKQFDDIGHHGTKIIVFNLWHNDDGIMELDFVTDAKDILISGAQKKLKKVDNEAELIHQSIASRYQFSLRVYASILYLKQPESFKIVLRKVVVEPHHLVKDLMYIECIRYRPQVDVAQEAVVDTTIGFMKGAPNINVHGFNVYHKNRLILVILILC
ncbi:hypothetical protein HPP92_009506 [Vanilla planifolia]|uniref:Morc S5 domain-containing protein n=1 Tax=Vanilla planifolia TaxID=51239 RepID=A0A835RE04_VANPL|nr:hypothetical protein HPP92_009506 [Vanilla planifolia]